MCRVGDGSHVIVRTRSLAHPFLLHVERAHHAAETLGEGAGGSEFWPLRINALCWGSPP